MRPMKLVCSVFGHKWEDVGQIQQTGNVVFNPGFRPVHELTRLCPCSRCGEKKWIDGYFWPPALQSYHDRFYPKDYAYDKTGWPTTKDGHRLPSAKNANRTGW